MSGGNISDGQKEGSGNVIELPVGKNVPEDVNEIRPPVRPVEQQLATLIGKYNREAKKWLAETNELNSKLREVRARAETGLQALRDQLAKKQEELEMSMAKFEKYLLKSEELEERIDELESMLENSVSNDEGSETGTAEVLAET